MRTPQRKPGKYAGKKPDPYITRYKYQELENKLERLKQAQAPAAEEVRRLASDGDFSENAAYQMAKGRLRGINQRITDIEDHLKRAVIIEAKNKSDRIALGSRVTIESNGKEKTYEILGPTETDPKLNIISHKSPLGSALINHRVGDTIKLKINNKLKEFKITRIE
jgi:transcription elongation factor GreA